jgi:hypothetical protein
MARLWLWLVLAQLSICQATAQERQAPLAPDPRSSVTIPPVFQGRFVWSKEGVAFDWPGVTLEWSMSCTVPDPVLQLNMSFSLAMRHRLAEDLSKVVRNEGGGHRFALLVDGTRAADFAPDGCVLLLLLIVMCSVCPRVH